MKCPYINPTVSQCEQCPFPDCVNDELSNDDYLASNELDKDIKYDLPSGDKRRIRKERGYDRKYYVAHREIILSKQAAQPEKHREANRKYYSENAEKERQRQKEKYIRDRDKRSSHIKEYNRLYYLRKKRERQAG
jgi:hypothetical protein